MRSVKRVIRIVAAVSIIVLAAGIVFAYVLYKVGEEMHMHRCGAAGRADRGFM